MYTEIRTPGFSNKFGDLRLFFLIGRQRSGTTLLRACLNSHPQVIAFGELFYPDQQPDFLLGYHRYKLDKIRDNPAWVVQERHELELLKHFFYYLLGTIDFKNVMLVDIKYSNTEANPAIWNYINTFKIPCIHLIRQNVLRTEISELISAKRMKNLESIHSFEKLSHVFVSVNLDTILLQLASRKYEQEYYRSKITHDFVLTLIYESLTERNGASTHIIPEHCIDICNFLRIESHDLKTNLVKQTSDDLTKVVENYDDLAILLRGTEFEAML